MQDVPLEISGRHNGPEGSGVKYIEDMPLDVLIKNYTESILARYRNNRTKASEVLGITRQRLRRILKSQPD